MTAIGSIRKALLAGGGSLLSGLYGVFVADGSNLAAITHDQWATVLSGALVVGVGVFTVPNKAAAPAAKIQAPVPVFTSAPTFTMTNSTAAAPVVVGRHTASVTEPADPPRVVWSTDPAQVEKEDGQ